MTVFRQIRMELKKTIVEMSQIMGISASLCEKLDYGYREPSLSILKKLKQVKPDLDMNIFFK